VAIDEGDIDCAWQGFVFGPKNWQRPGAAAMAGDFASGRADPTTRPLK